MTRPLGQMPVHPPRHRACVHWWRLAAGVAAPFLLGMWVRPVVAQDERSWRSRGGALLGDGQRCPAYGDAGAALSSGRMRAALTLGTSANAAMSGRLGTPLIALDAETPVRGGVTVRGATAAGRSASPCSELSRWSRGWLQLARPIGGTELAIAFGTVSLSAADPTRDREGVTASLSRASGRVEWGVALRRYARRAWEGGSVGVPVTTSGIDTLPRGGLPIPGSKNVGSAGSDRARQLQFVDTRAHWRWTQRRIAFELVAGGTVGSRGADTITGQQPDTGKGAGGASGSRLRTQLWGRADVRLHVAPAVTAMFGVSALPALPELGLGVRRFVSAGIELSSWRRPATSNLERREEGRAYGFEITRDSTRDESREEGDAVPYLLRVHTSRARKVEVAGDLSGWTAIALQARSGGWWEGSLRARPGSYRVSIRIDGGAWQAPPGYVAIRDEFGAHSAMVVVP